MSYRVTIRRLSIGVAISNAGAGGDVTFAFPFGPGGVERVWRSFTCEAESLARIVLLSPTHTSTGGEPFIESGSRSAVVASEEKFTSVERASTLLAEACAASAEPLFE
jgi:hypothetical protein